MTFSVNAAGFPQPSYVWYKDGFALPWATNSSLLLTNLSLNDGGQYSVLVTNALGSILSSNALLVVNPAGISLGIYPGVTIQGTVGNHYGIQYTTNMDLSGNWVSAADITLAAPVQIWTDTNANLAAGNNPHRFYRVVALP